MDAHSPDRVRKREKLKKRTEKRDQAKSHYAKSINFRLKFYIVVHEDNDLYVRFYENRDEIFLAEWKKRFFSVKSICAALYVSSISMARYVHKHSNTHTIRHT